MVAFAANVPLARDDLYGQVNGQPVSWIHDGYLVNPATPTHTMRQLGPSDAMIVATTMNGFTGPDVNFPARTLPLRLRDATVEHSWEGQVAPNVPEYRIWAYAHGVGLDVRVYFGTQHPSPRVRAWVDAELARLVIPGVEAPVATLAPLLSAKGWHVVRTNRSTVDNGVGSVPLAQVWASTEPFVLADLRHLEEQGQLKFAEWPAITILHHLPPDGVLIVATTLTYPAHSVESAPSDPAFPPTGLPLSLEGADVQPWRPWVNATVRRYEIDARVGNVYVVASVFFATSVPSHALLQKAQQELDTLELPRT